MALNNYNNLKASIANFLARQDLDTSIPDFITLCEARLNNNPDFRLGKMICKLGSDVIGTEVGLPVDYLGMRTLRIQDGSELVQVSPKVLQAKKRTSCTDQQYYVDLGNRIELYPGVTDMALEIFYYQRLPALSDMNASNWLLAQSPDVYLFGSLIEGSAFMKNDERVGLWATRYKDAVDSLIAADKGDRWSGIKAVELIK